MAFTRRNFIRNSGLSAAGFVFASREFEKYIPYERAAYAIPDKLSEADAATVNGFIGKKLDLSYHNRIMVQSSEELVQPFRQRTETHLWQSEFWGKWFTSAVLAYRYKPDPALMKILQSSVTALITTQTADGYIGNYKKENRLDQWDIWGMKYCLLGLLEYYDLTKDKKALQAAVRLTDYLIGEIKNHDGLIVNKGNYRGMAASSVLEAIGRLYIQTGDKKYLSFAEEIVRQWETPGGPNLISKSAVNVRERFPKTSNWYSWEQGQKAYEMMSCYEGLLELYRITGNELYKNAVEETWKNIRDTEINIAGSGASAEMWFGGAALQTTPVYHFQETCVTVTWIRFNQRLLKLTGEAKYAHAIEESYYNALLGALNADGSEWQKYTPLNGQRLPGTGQCGMKLNCCNANGPRAQFTLPLTTVMGTKDGLCINFFVPGSYVLKTPSGEKLSVIQQTDYPVSGKIEFGFEMDSPEMMTVKIRIPHWSKENILTINNEPVSEIIPGEYAEIKRNWSAKDKISLQLDMRASLIMKETDKFHAAIQRGPIVLARDTRLPDTDLGVTLTPVLNAAGYIELSPVDTGRD